MIYIIFRLLYNLFDLCQVSLSKTAKHWDSFFTHCSSDEYFPRFLFWLVWTSWSTGSQRRKGFTGFIEESEVYSITGPIFQLKAVAYEVICFPAAASFPDFKPYSEGVCYSKIRPIVIGIISILWYLCFSCLKVLNSFRILIRDFVFCFGS